MAIAKINGGYSISASGDATVPTPVSTLIGTGSRAGGIVVSGTFSGEVSIKATTTYMVDNAIDPVLIDNGSFTAAGCRSIDLSPTVKIVVEAESGFSGTAYVFIV